MTWKSEKRVRITYCTDPSEFPKVFSWRPRVWRKIKRNLPGLVPLYSPDELQGLLNAIGFSTVFLTVRKVNTRERGRRASWSQSHGACSSWSWRSRRETFPSKRKLCVWALRPIFEWFRWNDERYEDARVKMSMIRFKSAWRRGAETSSKAAQQKREWMNQYIERENKPKKASR